MKPLPQDITQWLGNWQFVGPLVDCSLLVLDAIYTQWRHYMNQGA